MALRFLPHAASTDTGKRFEIACTDDSVQLGDEYEIGVAPAGGIVFDSTVTSLNKEGKILFVSSLGFTQPGTYTISANAVLNPTNRVETTVQAEKSSIVINLPASEDEIPPIPDDASSTSISASSQTEAAPAIPEVMTTEDTNTTDVGTPESDAQPKKKSNALVYGAIAILLFLIGAIVLTGIQSSKNSSPEVAKTGTTTKPEPKQEAKTEQKTESDKPNQAAPTTDPSAPPAPPAPPVTSNNSAPRMPSPLDPWPTAPQTIQRVRL